MTELFCLKVIVCVINFRVVMADESKRSQSWCLVFDDESIKQKWIIVQQYTFCNEREDH
jgi:hypothetical protein